MKHLKNTIWIGILALAGTLFAASSAVAGPVLPAPTIEAGIHQSVPPFSYKEEGVQKGIAYDLLKAIGEISGFKVSGNPMGFSAMIPALQSSQIDVAVAGFFVTDERKKIIDFSTPFFREGSILVVPENSSIKVYSDLDGKVVVAQQGSAALRLLTKMAPQYNLSIRQVPDQATMLLMLESGNADAAFYDSAVIQYVIATQKHNALKTIGPVQDPTDIAFALSKNSRWTPILNDGLAQLQRTGKLQEIIHRYVKD